MAGYTSNNQMGSFNGNTVRLREVTVRGPKREDSAILTGLRLYHNFVRPHLGLPGNITPGEAAGIHIEGDNKWKTIIQNAARQRDAESKRTDDDGQAGKSGQADTQIRAGRSHGRWSAGVRAARHSRLADLGRTCGGLGYAICGVGSGRLQPRTHQAPNFTALQEPSGAATL